MAHLITDSDAPLEFEREDGGRWPFVMQVEDRLVYADSRTDLVATLIEDYSDHLGEEITTEDANELLILRYSQALAIADDIQGQEAAAAVSAGTWNPADATDEELTVLLASRDDQPTDITGTEHWDHPVSLVLVTLDFEPYSRRTPVTGNVKWIDPSDETTYLNSLAALGLIELFTDAG